LRGLRDEAGFTEEELGFEADLRRTYISNLKLDQQQPTLTTIFKLAKPLNRSIQEIVGLVEARCIRVAVGLPAVVSSTLVQPSTLNARYARPRSNSLACSSGGRPW
jgi:transcriptional regulator with XRE-family HTH domain